jgi:hypothetical protein
MKPNTDPAKIQGEGDYASDRRYRESVDTFVKSGRLADVAGAARPKTPDEEEELREAERIGESHSKGEDPALRHAPARNP